MAPDAQTVPQSAHDATLPILKRKRSRERARVTRACDRCKRRKVKCNGIQPCDFCFRAKAACTFDSAYARGRLPVIPSASGIETHSTPNQMVNVTNSSTSPSVHERPYQPTSTTEPTHQVHALPSQSQGIASTYDPSTSLGYVELSTRNSPEPSQTDLQGHYIGPASGVSFLLRVQKRLVQSISFSNPSSIFTFGDAPLHPPEFDPSFCMMLPKDDAQRLLDRYFDFAMPTYRFLHRPLVQEWFVEFYETLGLMRDTQSAPAKIALLFMVFAQGRVYMPDNDRPGPPDLSVRYFIAAEHQLTKERGSIRLTSVQARLTQCYYLLTQSRINHCYSLFGTISHLALAIGLNRNRHSDFTNGSSRVETELRRRTFWCAYTLDAYLSAALGRPRSFHDDDIDTELPACVEDHELGLDQVTAATPSRGQSIMLAPIAHIKIARIISRILRDLYSIKPISARGRATLTQEVSKNLSDWRADLARFLDADYFSTSLLIPIFQRQRNVLNLTYWHAVILTHRPYILGNLMSLSQLDSDHGNGDVQTEESVRRCLTAALDTVNTIDDITQDRQMFRAFWITAYFAFTANIVLYIYVIQKRASPHEVYDNYLSAAMRCQSHISAIAEKGSLSERYCLVLEELRLEALRQTDYVYPSVTGLTGLSDRPQESSLQTTSLQIGADPLPTSSYADLIDEGAIDFNDLPSATLQDYSGWGQFASMVSSGLGNLDGYLFDEPFRL